MWIYVVNKEQGSLRQYVSQWLQVQMVCIEENIYNWLIDTDEKKKKQFH